MTAFLHIADVEQPLAKRSKKDEDKAKEDKKATDKKEKAISDEAGKSD